MQKFFIQALYSDCLVSMAGICYGSPISAVPKNQELLCEKTMGVTFQIAISKTKGPNRIYGIQTGQTDMVKSTQLIVL